LKQVAVAILNWNGRALLERFLPDVVRFSKGADVYVIDNASTDDSFDFVQQQYPEVNWIANDGNYGYAGGYNRGLRLIPNPIHILLNSDVAVTEGWIEALEKLFADFPQMAACQPVLRDLKQPEKFEYAGAAGGFIDRGGYPFCRGRLFGILEADKGQYQTHDQIFWASGACLCIRKADFDAVGGLDEDFFAHMEEIDLCWRLQLAGHEIRLCPDAVVFHLGGGTLKTYNPKKTFLNFRNSLFCLVKNLPANRIFPTVFARLVLDGLAGVKFLFQMQGPHVLAILHAHFSFYKHLGRMLRKRKPHQVSHLQMGAYSGWIVWQHYFKGIKTFSDLGFNPVFKKHHPNSLNS
jgi:GT2 family glycosyltransferase